MSMQTVSSDSLGNVLVALGFRRTYGLEKGAPLTYNVDKDTVYVYDEKRSVLSIPKTHFEKVEVSFRRIAENFGLTSHIHAGDPS